MLLKYAKPIMYKVFVLQNFLFTKSSIYFIQVVLNEIELFLNFGRRYCKTGNDFFESFCQFYNLGLNQNTLILFRTTSIDL